MRDATENVWVDKNLLTANSAAGLDWAKAILEYLDVYPVETINTWCQYYSTGNPEVFFKLMANKTETEIDAYSTSASTYLS